MPTRAKLSNRGQFWPKLRIVGPCRSALRTDGHVRPRWAEIAENKIEFNKHWRGLRDNFRQHVRRVCRRNVMLGRGRVPIGGDTLSFWYPPERQIVTPSRGSRSTGHGSISRRNPLRAWQSHPPALASFWGAPAMRWGGDCSSRQRMYGIPRLLSTKLETYVWDPTASINQIG